MPTVIDQLVVELELDPSKFTKGQQEAVEKARQGEQDLTRQSKNFEQRGKSVGETFRGVTTKALGFFAVLAGANSLKDFVVQTIKSDQALGMLARNLGVGVEDLSKWQIATKQSGGTAEDTAQSMQALVNVQQQLQLTGSSPAVPFLRQVGITSLAELQDTEGALLKISTAMQNMDPQRAQAIGGGIGLTPGFISLLQRGPQAVQAYLDKAEAAGVVTAENAQAAQEWHEKLTLLTATMQNFGRDVITALTPTNAEIEDLTRNLGLATEGGRNLWQAIKDILGLEGESVGMFAGIGGMLRDIGYLANSAASGLKAVWYALLAVNAARKGNMDAAYDYGRASGQYTNAAGSWLKAIHNAALADGQRAQQQAQADAAGGSGAPRAIGRNADAAIRTIAFEARGNAVAQKDVAHVIINRVKASGKGAEAIVKQRGQFQPWADKPGEMMALDVNSKRYQDAKAAYLAAIADDKAGRDPTQGATLFYSPSGQQLNVAQGKARSLVPNWARGTPTLQREGHKFYTGAFPGMNSRGGGGGAGGNKTDIKSDVRVGTVVVQTQATDAPGIARDIGKSLEQYNYVAQANTGVE